VGSSRYQIENVLQGSNWKDFEEDFRKDIELYKKKGVLYMPAIYATGMDKSKVFYHLTLYHFSPSEILKH